MLPKVATHLLHTTTRSAAAAVHNNTSTLRNVLQGGASAPSGSAGPSSSAGHQNKSKAVKSAPAKQLKPVTIALVSASGTSLASAAPQHSTSSGPSSEGNSRGTDDAHSRSGQSSGSRGSAKNGSNNPKAGRRFYTNYNSASRAVTQANAIIITEDVPGFKPTATEDHTQESRRAFLAASASRSNAGSHKRKRLRSSSVNTLLPRREKEGAVVEKISVLKTVQLQARSLHVLSAAATAASAATSASASAEPPAPSPSAVLEVEDEVVVAPTPIDAVASATSPASPKPASPVAPRPRSPAAVSTSPRPRSPLRRRNSTSSVGSPSRPGTPLLFVDQPPQVEVHFHARAMSTVASKTKSPSPSPVMSDSGSASASEVSATTPPSSAPTSVHESQPEARRKEKNLRNPFSVASSPSLTELGTYLREASRAKNAERVHKGVRRLLEASRAGGLSPVPPGHIDPTIADFNMALRALYDVKVDGQTITPTLEVYQELLNQGKRPPVGTPLSARPNLKTYAELIRAFTSRDFEIHRMLISLGFKARMDEASRNTQSIVQSSVQEAWDTKAEIHEQQVSRLTEESDAHFVNAVKLFEAVVEVGGRDMLEHSAYIALLRSCAVRGHLKAALHVFQQYENLVPPVGLSKNGNTWWAASAKGKPDFFVDGEAYKYLIQTFTNAGDIAGAERVFEAFKAKAEKGSLHVLYSDLSLYNKMLVQVYNQIMETWFRKGEPEKALDLLDVMLKASSEGRTVLSHGGEGPAVPPVPSPAGATFTTIIGGFIKMGDVATAHKWFQRLLQEQDSPNPDPFAGIVNGQVVKPDQIAWTLMVDALASAGKVDELNALWTRAISGTNEQFEEPRSREGVIAHASYRQIVYQANYKRVQDTLPITTVQDMDAALRTLAFLEDMVLPKVDDVRYWFGNRREMIEGLTNTYVQIGAYEQGYQALDRFIRRWVATINSLDRESVAAEGPNGPIAELILDLQHIANNFWEHVFARIKAHQDLPWSVSIGLARLNTEALNMKVVPEQALWLLHSYGLALAKNDLSLTVQEVPVDVFRILLSCAVHVDSELTHSPDLLQRAGVSPEHAQLVPTVHLLQHIAARGIAFDDNLADAFTRSEAVQVVCHGFTAASASREFFANLGPTYLEAYEQQTSMQYQALQGQLESAVPADHPMQPQERLDLNEVPMGVSAFPTHSGLSLEIDKVLKNSAKPAEDRAVEAYSIFRHAFDRKSVVPTIPTINRLIQATGRIGRAEWVGELYHVAQRTLASMPPNMPEKRREMWVMIEDGMVIALAHAGDVEGAHVHRRRILELGGPLAAPSADAYGALILYVKDTTDDASNSLMLWNEAMRVGVVPNIYLFNNIISKLSRARKADYALDLFHMMKEQGAPPSSITYGAVIGACARVADVVSAEALFKEMMEQSNFKPRVPPFNTMMQVYTTTRPNRERALYFYETMKKVRVQPTAHTYKLLLDVYGAVEPLDIAGMESVFTELKANPRVPLQGTHFASLINAYGCVLKDVKKAISVFDSIPTHKVQGKPLVADAVVYEAMVNALVANKRMDLIPAFMQRMVDDKVHMTAYVANFLIKGYANVGDIAQARSVFEGMQDPPTGVAAPNNHAPHDPSAVAQPAGVMDPVYREPSTWEAMIRAELGVGNRDRAHELLERLKVRQYPEAVFNRISGVLVDHSSVVMP